jgi:hypothetical protein
MDNQHILTLRHILSNVAVEICVDGEYKRGSFQSTGEKELAAIEAFFKAYIFRDI